MNNIERLEGLIQRKQAEIKNQLVLISNLGIHIGEKSKAVESEKSRFEIMKKQLDKLQNIYLKLLKITNAIS